MRGVWLLLGATGLWWLSYNYAIGEWPILPLDFSVFWGAALRLLSGHANEVYDGAAHVAYIARLHGVAPVDGYYYPYPPTSLLFVWPLGLLPFPVAWVAFLLPGMAAFFYVVRRLTDGVTAAGMTFAIGGPTYAIQIGQNGFYSAALLGGGLLALRHNKTVAGIAIGLLTLKPQLALIAFLALLYWREWRALGTAIAVVATLVIATTAIFGFDIWAAFLGGNTSFFDLISAKQDTLIRFMHQSVLALFIPSLGPTGALFAQAFAGVTALGVTATLKNRDAAICGVIASTLLFTPFAFLYDGTMLLVGFAILLRHRRWDLAFAGLTAITGLWFLTMGSLVPVAALGLLVAAWLFDKTEARESLPQVPPIAASMAARASSPDQS